LWYICDISLFGSLFFCRLQLCSSVWLVPCGSRSRCSFQVLDWETRMQQISRLLCQMRQITVTLFLRHCYHASHAFTKRLFRAVKAFAVSVFNWSCQQGWWAHLLLQQCMNVWVCVVKKDGDSHFTDIWYSIIHIVCNILCKQKRRNWVSLHTGRNY